jgi:hypothetical protein
MNRRPTEQHQPTSPRSDTARDVWVDILADIIVTEVLHGQESEIPNQGNEV